MRWLLALFAPLPLLVLDGVLGRSLGAPVLTLGLCLFLATHARTSALPGLLIAVALARAVLVGGDLGLHVLALGIPIAVLVPMRAVFSRRHALWQLVGAAFLAVSVPHAFGLFGGLAQDLPPPQPLGWRGLAGAIAASPLVAWLLAHVPPLRWFRESAE